MRCPALQAIARMGRWTRFAMHNAYLLFFKPESLLASAGWPGAAQKDFNTFFHPRMLVVVADELVEAVFPFLRVCRSRVKELGSKATTSMPNVVKALTYLGIVGELLSVVTIHGHVQQLLVGCRLSRNERCGKCLVVAV
jgi:hypothetical protein